MLTHGRTIDLTIHYGYAGLAERSDDDKAWEFFIEEVSYWIRRNSSYRCRHNCFRRNIRFRS